MAGSNPVKYSDLVKPDDSIKNLISELTQLKDAYSEAVTTIKQSAADMQGSMKSYSGATSEGRKKTDEAAAAASRLEQAQKELAFSISETGKQVAWLKSQTSDNNSATVSQNKLTATAATSYNKIAAEVKSLLTQYKSLTAVQRDDATVGGAILTQLTSNKVKLAELDAQLKLHVVQVTAVEKAEQRLQYLQSAEGQQLLSLKSQISAVTAEHSKRVAVLTPLQTAEAKLAYAMSDENVQIKLLSTQMAEANAIAKLTAQLKASEANSYNALSAQYSLNKIELNKLSAEQRSAGTAGAILEKQTAEIYAEMIRMQEATGKYSLSVGNYAKTWDGMTYSVTQVVREMPAAAVSLNTFFLAISNNVPMVIDEINKLKAANVELAKSNQSTISISKKIVSALFSWNSALVVILTVFSMFGKQIIAWIGQLGKASGAASELAKVTKNLAKELEEGSDSYGDQVVKLKTLTKAWKELSTEAEKQTWISNQKSDFDELGIAILDVADAENAFVENTDSVIEALKLRAKATAGYELASEKYKEALVKQNEADIKTAEGVKDSDLRRASFTLGSVETSFEYSDIIELAEFYANERVSKLNDEIAAIEEVGDAYFKLASDYEEASKETLNSAGIGLGGKSGGSSKEGSDISDSIYKTAASLQTKYEKSITALQTEELKKRKSQIVQSYDSNVAAMKLQYDKNEEILANANGKYKTLTDEQIAIVKNSQQTINKTIANYNAAYLKDLSDLLIDSQLLDLAKTKETIDLKLAAVKQGTAEELELRQAAIEAERAMALANNSKLPESEQLEASLISASYDKQIASLSTDFDSTAFSQQQALELARFDLVVHTEKDITDFKLQQEKERWLQQIALAESGASDWTQAQIDAAKLAVQAIDKELNSFDLDAFGQQQELELARFEAVKQTEKDITEFKLQQEKDRLTQLIKLAEAGGLGWTQTQIETAKASVVGIERELSELESSMQSFMQSITDRGLGESLLESLGFNDDQIDALSEAADIVIEQFGNILDAEVELAEAAVDAADTRVSAAQDAYDAEVEARANGYASSVATAKAELAAEEAYQAEKLAILEEAERKQAALDTLTQASSLITASAQLWSAFSAIPVVGPALAIAAIATMWGSFAAAKVKANQVTSASDSYGDGGLEFLEGGSHASGNDISLGTTNSKGKNMRAEGGEAMAIINKRSTSKYKRYLPDIINSLNKGIFESRYASAFSANGMDNVLFSPVINNNTDLSKLEKDVRYMRKANSSSTICLQDGTILKINKNVTQRIKKL